MNLDKSAIVQIKSVAAAQNKNPCLRIIIIDDLIDFHYDDCKDINYGGCFAISADGVTFSGSADCKHLVTGRTLYYNTNQGFQLL